jgi:5-methylcytosine-specific restriction endonuclease McrA
VATRRLLINGALVIDPRQTRAWRRLRDQVVREEPTCRLRFPGVCTLVSTTGDHIIPVTERPELALIRTNVRGSCMPCNEARRTVPDESLRLDGKSDALSIFRR